MTERENWLRAVEFRYPEWIPCSMHFSLLNWKVYREDLENIVLAHPRIFPEYEKGSRNFDELHPGYRNGEYFRDNWGCLWHNIQEGLEGLVVENPLADWNALATYRPPDYLSKTEVGERDWNKIEKDIAKKKKKGFLTTANGERLFDRLYFLRGFENLMIDIATDDPHLPKLIDMLLEYELNLVNRFLQIDRIDVIGFHTDIGTQNSLMINPDKFRKYIKPMFKKIFQICRNAGTHVWLSSDGCLLEIVDDLIECGVSVHGPQERANTLEGIAKVYKGRLCACVDLDRQSLPFAKPKEIHDQVKKVVDIMGDSKGGLMIDTGIFGTDVSLKNIEAICEAMEKFCFR